MKKLVLLLIVFFLISFPSCKKKEEKVEDFPSNPPQVKVIPPKPKAAYHNDRGCRLMNKEKYKEAMWEFKKAIKADPNYPVSHCNLAALYEKMGVRKEAINEYKAALKLQPGRQDVIEALTRLGEK